MGKTLPRTGVGCLKFATIRSAAHPSSIKKEKKKKSESISEVMPVMLRTSVKETSLETKDAEKDPDLCVRLYQQS